MNVPQPLSLTGQTFNTNFVEFVWQFPVTDDDNDQVILQVNKGGTVYLEGGRLDCFGDYNNRYEIPDYFVEDVEPAYFLGDVNKSLDYVTRYLTYEEIVKLAEDCVKFLNE